MAIAQLTAPAKLNGREITLGDGTTITVFSGAVVTGQDGSLCLFDSPEKAAVYAAVGFDVGPAAGVRFVSAGEPADNADGGTGE